MRPNDPLYSSQRGLRRVNPEHAWDRVRRLQQRVTIAFLDTGIDTTHPDLADKIVPGRNFVNPIIPNNNVTDIDGHGTKIAGAAAAVTNNGIGMAGISFNTASIMPIKVLENFEDNVTPASLIAGIRFAVNNGAQVINMSTFLINYGYNQAVQTEIDRAWNRGLVLVAAAGNDGTTQVYYPAGYNHVLAVSAINNNDQKLDSSNFGVDIGIASPGENVLSAAPGGGYDDQGSGTSVATAFVSGLAAMLIAANPRLTNQQVVEIIQRSAEVLDLGGRTRGRSPGRSRGRSRGSMGWSPIFGYGLINASNAMKLATTGHRRRSRTGQLGSLYGQVINRRRNPVAGARVIAEQGDIRSEYVTNDIVPIIGRLGRVRRYDSNGMFRLSNLPPGNYNITVDGVQVVADVVGGADTFLTIEI